MPVMAISGSRSEIRAPPTGAASGTSGCSRRSTGCGPNPAERTPGEAAARAGWDGGGQALRGRFEFSCVPWEPPPAARRPALRAPSVVPLPAGVRMLPQRGFPGKAPATVPAGDPRHRTDRRAAFPPRAPGQPGTPGQTLHWTGRGAARRLPAAPGQMPAPRWGAEPPDAPRRRWPCLPGAMPARAFRAHVPRPA